MATPLAFVTALPTPTPFKVKSIVFPLIAAPPEVRVRVAVIELVLPPYVPVALETLMEVAITALNVAVKLWAALLMLNVQGEVVPVHVVVPPLTKEPDHPAKTEPAFAVTVMVPVALLSNASLHVATHGFAVGAGDAGVTPENATDPLPVPANVIVRFLLSLNVVCA